MQAALQVLGELIHTMTTRYSAMLILFLFATANGAGEDFTYDRQGDWQGVCNANNRMEQSPINIVTENVQINRNLIDLQFTGWSDGIGGFFSNPVIFYPSTMGRVRTRTHLGTYDLLQFHMHWGNRSNEGSEHLINGTQQEMEIHFVHTLSGSTDMTRRPYLSVIGVLMQADPSLSMSSPPWSIINASAVLQFQSNISVSGLILDQLLPTNRDYYYYEGSLTTPPCSEIVAWFVMKNTIRVPQEYFELMQRIEIDSNGMIFPITFRSAQPLGSRVVSTQSHAFTLHTFTSFSLFALMLAFYALW